MIFHRTEIPGALLIEPTPHRDARGSFARTYCAEEFAGAGLPAEFVQISQSENPARGTLRGMHWQAAPDAEGKVVRCLAGAIYDVALDLRQGTAGFGRWQAFELNAENGHAVYLPPGVAHGFLTLAEGVQVSYMTTVAYAPESARGLRWNDPAFAISWPFEPLVISPKDAGWPDFIQRGGSEC